MIKKKFQRQNLQPVDEYDFYFSAYNTFLSRKLPSYANVDLMKLCSLQKYICPLTSVESNKTSSEDMSQHITNLVRIYYYAECAHSKFQNTLLLFPNLNTLNVCHATAQATSFQFLVMQTHVKSQKNIWICGWSNTDASLSTLHFSTTSEHTYITTNSSIRTVIRVWYKTPPCCHSTKALHLYPVLPLL